MRALRFLLFMVAGAVIAFVLLTLAAMGVIFTDGEDVLKASISTWAPTHYFFAGIAFAVIYPEIKQRIKKCLNG